MSEDIIDRIRPHERTGDDATISIRAKVLREVVAEIERLREQVRDLELEVEAADDAVKEYGYGW